MTKRRPVALGAAITIGFGSLFFAAPALADDVETPTDQQVQEAPSPAELETKVIESATAFEAATGETPVAAGANSGSGLVILADKNAKTEKVLQYADAIESGEVTGVSQILFSEPAVAYADTDVVGGAGYLFEAGGRFACSIGFSAWAPNGDPALISAGHCAKDGSSTNLNLSEPSSDPANGGLGGVVSSAGQLGSFGFNRFGGPGNTNGAEDDPTSSDVSIIDITNSALTAHPEVTDWESADSDDLSTSTVSVRGVADPTSGAVAKSGRTTGYTEGNTTVQLEDQNGNPVSGEILDGYVQIDGRWVHGFISSTAATQGDSGGAVIQGDQAVGVVSGGPQDGSWLWSTRLKDALELTGGYEVALDIDAPSVDTDLSGEIAGGSDIVVSAPSNATEISVGTGNSGDTIPVTNGKATFTAPTIPGDYTYTISAHNGKSSSDSVTAEFTVALASPAIDTTKFTSNEVTITGTGVADATVNLFLRNADGIGESHSTTVESDGTWSVDAELGYGTFDYELSQSLNGEDSSVVEGEIKVLPAAPGNPTIANGSEFPVGEGPTSLSGTGINDANVSLEFTEGTQPAGISNSTQVAEGEWGFDFGAPLPSGSYTLTITQSVTNPEQAPPVLRAGADGAPDVSAFLVGASEDVVTSDPTVITFVVAAAVDPGANAGGAADGGSAAGGGADGTAGAGGGAADGTATAGGGAGAGAGANGTAGAGASGTAGAGTGADGAKLVNTGFDAGSLVPFGIAALGMLVLGAGAIVLTQRRLRATETQ